MITLPPSFNVATLITDFQTLILPFVGIAFLFVTYRIIIRAIGGGRG